MSSSSVQISHKYEYPKQLTREFTTVVGQNQQNQAGTGDNKKQGFVIKEEEGRLESEEDLEMEIPEEIPTDESCDRLED